MKRFKILLMSVMCLFFLCKEAKAQTDETIAIQELLDKAFDKNEAVYLEARYYYVTNLNIKVNIIGKKGTVIQRINNKSSKEKDEKYNFCRIDNIHNIKIENVVFNGSNSGINDTSGVIPLFILNSSNINIQNCQFINSNTAGLRISHSNSISILNSKSSNNYGTFGDGFYVEQSNNISFENCVADNYNRIGFVLDLNVKNVVFKNCKASNGNNASILTGGIEQNAGFWFEKAGDISVIDCTANNNTHYGFLAVSGLDKSDENVSFNFQNCRSYNNNIGFKAGSLGKNAVKVSFKGCETTNVKSGIEISCKNINDIYLIESCKIGYNVGNDYSTGIFLHTRYDGKSLVKCDVRNTIFVYPQGASNSFLKSKNSYNSDIYIDNVNRVLFNFSNNSNNISRKILLKSPTINSTFSSSIKDKVLTVNSIK
ncbi:right-handed parallel beta-helix repeat-containing protein [Sphingobacterium sp. Mn56C]|uniref:right-handed parallel beta-helix repeat-containing protein n=1 Tax=Sphingobacterium sp. Mn56C TaxID=3395261 RepID=UPI003BEB238C